jgi:hypothetical protein
MRRIHFDLIIAALAVVVIGALILANFGGGRPAAPGDPAGETQPDPVADAPTQAGGPKPAARHDDGLEVTWENKVRYGADTAETHGAIAGRVRLTGGEEPREGADALTVTLYNHTPAPGRNEPVPTDEWRVDSAILKHWRVEGSEPPEYRLLLRWGSYSPDVTEVRLEAVLELKSGKKLTAESDVLTVDNSEMKERGGN